MTRDQFYENLSATDLLIPAKLDTCNYFLKYYPVKIQRRNPMNPFSVEDTWTKLDYEIPGGSDESINKAFNGLVKNVNKLKDFDNGKF
jgi:hypothetical protein